MPSLLGSRRQSFRQHPLTWPQTTSDVLGPSAVVLPAIKRPPEKIIVDPPLAESLADGLAFIQYRIENLRIVPVFGANAFNLPPHIEYSHIGFGNAPWH